MGLGIYASAPLPRRGLTKRSISRAHLFKEVCSAAEQHFEGKPESCLLNCFESDNVLCVSIHPAGEPLSFEVDGERVIAGAKTSTAGPGFHAAALELLRAIGRTCGIDWDWTDGDETGFLEHRDFARLQQSMADFLQTMANSFLSDPDLTCVGVNMPMGVSGPTDVYSFTPTGIFGRDWWESVRRGEDLVQKAIDFYPWWNQARDAEFWRRAGVCLLWVQVPWHPPASEEEQAVCERAIACFTLARSLDPTILLPEPEIRELQGMLECGESDLPPIPVPGRIGYSRGESRQEFGGGWSIMVPSYYYRTTDDDETTLVFYHGRRVIRVSRFSLDPPPGSSGEPASLLNGAEGPGVGPDQPEHGRVVLGNYKTSREEEDGQAYCVLLGQAAIRCGIAVVTVCFDDPADEPWAYSVFRSVDHWESDERV